MREELFLILPDWLDWVAFFHFLRPLWLLGVPFVMLLIWMHRRESDTMRQWKSLLSEVNLKALTVSGGKRGLFSPPGMSALVAVLFSVILAGPSWERQDSPFAEDHAPLVIL